MSTLVSLLLATVLNFIGGEMPKEVDVISNSKHYLNEIKMCDEQSLLLASNCIIIKNEQLFKVKGIR
jgi:hypothetical protein